MRSHDLHSCKTEEGLKALLVADGLDPSLSPQVIAKYGLNIEKVEVHIQGDVHIGDKYEHNYYYACCDAKEKEPQPKKVYVPVSVSEEYEEYSLDTEENSNKVFWFLVNGVFYATVAFVALLLAVVAGVGHVSYKLLASKEEHEQIAQATSKEEKAVEEVVQPKPVQLTRYEKSQKATLAHKLEMKKMEEEIRQVDLRRVAQQIVWEREANKGNNPKAIDTEVIENAKLIT